LDREQRSRTLGESARANAQVAWPQFVARISTWFAEAVFPNRNLFSHISLNDRLNSNIRETQLRPMKAQGDWLSLGRILGWPNGREVL
jgi:hypothetical protein